MSSQKTYIQLPNTEASGAANVGTGAEIYKGQTGPTLNFRSLVAGANIAINQGTNEIEILSNGAAFAFTQIQTPLGSSPAATGPADTLTLTSTDNTVLITGTAGTDTINFQTNVGNVNSGTAGRIALYPGAGAAVDDQYSQTGFNLDVQVASHTLAADRTYTLSDVGANASFVMTQGAQTLAGNKTFTNSVVVGGDLTVNGTITTLNTQTLDVADKNIRVNKGGTTIGAAGAGIDVEGDAAATVARLLFDSTLTSKWKIGDGSTQSEVITAAGSQTLSGSKTLSGTVNLSTLTASRVLQLDSSKNVQTATTTTTELGYLSGVTSAVQTQLDARASLASDNTLSGINSVTGQLHFPIATLTDGVNISWNLTSRQNSTVTLGGNRTLDNPTNMKSGATYSLIVKQDATGSRTLAFGSAYKFPGAAIPTLSTAANAVDILTFLCDGTNMYGVTSRNFS